MLRAATLNLLSILLTAGVGALACVAFGRSPHPREMLAAGICLFVVTELAMLPLLLTRGAKQMAVAQAALVATIVHMMLAATFAAVVILGHLPLGQAFLYWLLAFYWMTLIVVAAECVAAVKRALPEPSTKH